MLLLLAMLAAQADPVVQIGTVYLDRTEKTEVALPEGLTLAPCVLATPAQPKAVDPVGSAVIELKVKRGKVALVTTTTSDDTLTPMTACFERELAAAEWPIRRGKLAVPVDVTAAQPTP